MITPASPESLNLNAFAHSGFLQLVLAIKTILGRSGNLKKASWRGLRRE
jgi:hypothetical protein